VRGKEQARGGQWRWTVALGRPSDTKTAPPALFGPIFPKSCFSIGRGFESRLCSVFLFFHVNRITSILDVLCVYTMWWKGVTGDCECGVSRVLVYMLCCGRYGLPHGCLICVYISAVFVLLCLSVSVMSRICHVSTTACHDMNTVLVPVYSWCVLDVCVCLT